MPRLIVDDGGNKKAFRVSQGRLTIGSGPGAKLALSSAGVEAEHATLVVRPEGAKVQVQAPVTIGGRQVTAGEVDLPFGATLAVGGATIVVEADAAESAAPARPAAPTKTGAKAATKSGAAAAKAPAPGGKGAATALSGGGAAPARSGTRRNEGGTGRRRGAGDGEGKKKLPVWVPLVGVVVLIVGLTYFFSGIGTSSRAENALTAAAISLDNGNLDTAREQLARVDRGDLEGDLLRRYDELSGQLEAREQFTGDSEVRSAATRWIDEELRALVDKQFKTLPPEPAKVRLLLDRIAQWRELFPQHNSEAWRLDNNLVADLAWIAEHEQKWADLANRSDRYTLADAEFRAYYFLDKAPKRYHEVMPVVTAALNSSTDEMERELLTSLRDRLLSEQRTYAAEQLAKARQFYEEGNDVQSSRILVTDIRTLTEPDLIDTAADMLLRFERARELLKGYRTRPVDYEALMRVPKVAAFMATLTAEETAPGS